MQQPDGDSFQRPCGQRGSTDKIGPVIKHLRISKMLNGRVAFVKHELHHVNQKIVVEEQRAG